MSLIETAEATMTLGSSILVSTASTGNGLSSYRSTPENSVDKSGWISGYGSIRPSSSYSVSQSKIISAVPKLQIGPILCFLGLLPPIFDRVYDLLWDGVLIPFAPF